MSKSAWVVDQRMNARASADLCHRTEYNMYDETTTLLSFSMKNKRLTGSVVYLSRKLSCVARWIGLVMNSMMRRFSRPSLWAEIVNRCRG
ncbi:MULTISPECIES: hypothetical protein [unclassified Brenneria]|uniref:hypothetical protein n=1 Tax=unclassified Brenneria TaxID=2634434 RepID=UPI0015559F5C|nr:MULTISPECIES: hypothetical protein [unclassified Brenneria]MBJ7222235.1 hypothetical protein [Brenneria sp. L3-3C-1]MEE3643478.1 hypothetical protein [Brenneria sp. L3_3C_1]MEE3651662.1 hypothetical protein [Brenneria sp. HEZEL_4_2_4]NPD01619.1 hypothetical protein [Brenneria sp. hezel4-2-4]